MIDKVKLVFDTLYSLLKVLRYSSFRGFNYLNNLQIKHQSNTVRILGNGESLNNILNSIKDSNIDYMVMNRHILSKSYKEIRPKFYILADPHFFLHPEGLSVFNKIISDTTWHMYLFIPYCYSKQLKVKNEQIQVLYYNQQAFNGFSSIKNYLYEHNLAIPRVQNVLVAAIYISICLKYKTIELYGVEHSWTKHLSVNDNNEVCLENPHFFDKEKVEKKTWKEIQHTDAHLHEILRMYAHMFESYFELQELATKENIKILNGTENSFIDAFERIR